MGKLTMAAVKAQAADRERQRAIARMILAAPQRYKRIQIEWARLVLAPNQGGAVR